MGQLELEIILGEYFDKNKQDMTYDQLVQFEDEVLDTENPILQKYLLSSDPVDDKYVTPYLKSVKEYVA